MNKDFIIAGLSVWVLYLLTKKETPAQQQQTVDLRNNAVLHQDDGEDNFKATIYAEKPIKATVSKQQGNKYFVAIPGSTYDDYLQPKIGSKPFIF